jgi:hypothetical protein
MKANETLKHANSLAYKHWRHRQATEYNVVKWVIGGDSVRITGENRCESK